MSAQEPLERTSERLARVLLERGLPELAAQARRFLYDDYRSDVAMNIHLLVNDLRAAPGDHRDLIERARAGEWDGQAWEAEEWSRSPEGREIFAIFGRPGGTGAFGQPL